MECRYPDGYQMISFDVVSLFTNVPLDKTIDIIIKKVYKEKRIKTKIKTGKLRKLLYLCTKEGHFTFNAWASVKGTQGARKPPHFSDTHVGGPYRCGEGAPLYLLERGFTVNNTKLMVVTEQ